jgi:hypothetical protein
MIRIAPRLLAIAGLWLAATGAQADALRERGRPVTVANSTLTVVPPRDWNRLGGKPGKHAEVWTLDGVQLNDVTFYGGIASGEPLVKERHRKREPLPKLRARTLLIEIPELLEGTYRAYKKIGDFTLTGSTQERFLGREGVRFTYSYVDQDALPRKGEARAVLVDRKLYMITFDAPRRHFFDKTLGDFRALAETARLEEARAP